MQNLSLCQFIDDWYKTHSAVANSSLIKKIKENEILSKELREFQQFECESIQQELYNFINNISKIPECPSCKSILPFKTLSSGYKKYCNNSCQMKYEFANGKRKDTKKNADKNTKEKAKNLHLKYTLLEFIDEWYKSHNQMANFQLINLIKNNTNYKQTLQNFCVFKTDNVEQMLWHFINKTPNLPHCKCCDNTNLKFSMLSIGYSEFCSKSCATKYLHKINKIDYDKCTSTFKERYGVGTSGHQGLLEKRENTSIEKYGTTHHMKNNGFLEKYKQIIFDIYGVDNVMHNSIIKEKQETTNLKKYNAISPFGNKEIQEKAQRTAGTRHSFKETNLEYQASYEKHFLEYCENLGILDKVNNGPFLWYENNGKRSRYFSDFIIEELNLIIEIKSKYYYEILLDQNLRKQTACINEGFNFIFIIDKDYSNFNKYIKQLIKDS